MTIRVLGATGHNGRIVLWISPHLYHQQVGDVCFLRDILLKPSCLAFSAMRTHSLTKSRAFSALIFLLSLGPLAINAVCFLRCLGEFTHSHRVMCARFQALLGLGFSGYFDPMFGCVVLEAQPSEQVYIG